jgi:hypothetical protein
MTGKLEDFDLAFGMVMQNIDKWGRKENWIKHMRHHICDINREKGKFNASSFVVLSNVLNQTNDIRLILW